MDGEAASRDAIAVAARLAALVGARLHLVHAIEGLRSGPPSTVLDETRVADAFAFAERRLVEERTDLRSTRASSVECVRLGHAAAEVVETARDRAADLIITGTRERPGAHRLAGESTAGEIVRRSHVPVLVVHEGTRLPREASHFFRHPLVAVDYAAASAAALLSAAVVAPAAELDVIHAVASDPAPGTDLASCYARARAVASERERLEQWIRATLDEPRPPSRAIVTVGDPTRALVDAAVGGGYDLVACGTHARPGRSPGELGSVAEVLLDVVKCPVLVLREASGVARSAAA